MSETREDFFDEDAAMCECGHIARDHASRAWRYACCHKGCKCTGFQSPPEGAPLPSEQTAP